MPPAPAPGSLARAWSVTARGSASVQVRGRNWIVALGRGLEEMGRAEGLSRLACEVLPNGTVIARDVSSGAGYVVQAVEGGVDLDVGGALDASDLPTAETTSEIALPADDPTDRADAVEDEVVDSLYELPADALSELPEGDELVHTIVRAESTLEACQAALAVVREHLQAESGAVILEERGVLRFVAVEGPSAPRLLGVRMPVGIGVAGFAMERRRSVVLADAHSDPRHLGEVDALTGYVTRNLAVVPLVGEDAVLGVLEVMNLPDERRFDDGDLDILDQVASALTARLG